MQPHDSQTPSAARVLVLADGEPHDVTEETKMILDALHSSLDWGSGFLSTEEVEAWERVAGLLGFNKGWPK